MWMIEFCFGTFHTALYSFKLHWLCLTAALNWGVFIASWSANTRTRVQKGFRWVLNCSDVEAASSVTGAAGIAALVGVVPVQDVLLCASKRFHCIALDKLCDKDLEDSKPNPTLFTLTSFARLGRVDAFVSHSWSDNAPRKWQVLQNWVNVFENLHGRAPTLWLDKCCIDQANLDADLSALPIYLAGCSGLIVVLGKTYLTRIWCILELFTYMHVCGRERNIDVLLLDAPAVLMQEINAFDVANCLSSNQEDLERIRMIITAVFHSDDTFNRELRRLLRSLVKGSLINPIASFSSAGSFKSHDSRSSDGRC